jgi:hypothetical protein
MFRLLTTWCRERLRPGTQKRRTPLKQTRKRFLAVEQLEDRVALSTVTVDSTTAVNIPLGNVKAGQAITFTVNFSTSDSSEGPENEPVVFRSTGGFSFTDPDFATKTITFTATRNGERLRALIRGADGDETATITSFPTSTVPTPSAKIAINDTPARRDNIVLYNPPGSTDPFTQTINAKVTNTSSASETLQLQALGVGSGAVTLSQSSLTLAAHSSTEVTITPIADSSAPFDVHIVAMDGGKKLAEDDMTVVGVTFPQHIRNTDTPRQMTQDRIPPRVKTRVNITVTPTLKGSGQKVTLIVTGQSADDGTVTFNGNATQNVFASRSVSLLGMTQTAGSAAAPGANAGKLNLVVQVNGQNTAQSNGFSVAAIPIKWTDTFVRALGGGQRGFVVQDGWQSDSGNIADLGDIAIRERVQYLTKTGIFAHIGTSNSGYIGPATSFTTDTHGVALAAITAAPHTGVLMAAQTSEFLDYRTGALNIPLQNSGYLITKRVYKVGHKVYIQTTKVGKAETALGISSAAGQGHVTLTQFCGNF